MRPIHLFSFVFTVIVTVQAQIDLPKASPKASVHQRIGISEIVIDYHRPAVRNREIWGKLLPLEKVWRAGANENTVIRFSHDFRINGNVLKAGSYGLHMIPMAKDWTVILSTNSNSWGSYSYKEEEDAIRLQVTPLQTSHQEFLLYRIEPFNHDSARIVLNWEKLEISFWVSFDSKAILLNNLKSQIENDASSKNLNPAAQYLMQNTIELDLAMQWIEQSIRLGETDENLAIKAQLLLKKNRKVEAKKLFETILKMTKNDRLKKQIENLVKENY